MMNNSCANVKVKEPMKSKETRIIDVGLAGHNMNPVKLSLIQAAHVKTSKVE